jgi:hypothetical protein
MKSHFAIMLGLLAWSLGGTPALASSDTPSAETVIADEATVARDIYALHHPHASARAEAAQELCAVVARYPSGTTDLRRPDAGRAFWEQRLSRIKPGMTEPDVLRLLDNPKQTMSIGSGQSHSSGYRLDDHWTASVTYANPDMVLEAPRLGRSERIVNVAPPARFTGTWPVYFANGQKAYSISYRDGVYDGTFTSYHDNGNVATQQHYRSGVADGSDRGWYADGKPMYSGDTATGSKKELGSNGIRPARPRARFTSQGAARMAGKPLGMRTGK